LIDVAAVPHSTDVWAVGQVVAGLNYQTFEARRHHGHWRRVAAPKPFGAEGTINTIAAGSERSVWIGGAKQVHTTQQLPEIWTWNGTKFVAAHLPAIQRQGAGDDGVRAMSASSRTNAWAVGAIDLVSTHKLISLHWNGKKWSAVPLPAGIEDLTAVSTSSVTNAWAVTDDNRLLHWNGKVWAVNGAAPNGVELVGVATASPTKVYAVGFRVLPHDQYGVVIRRFNGKAWSPAPIAHGVPHTQPFSIAMHGASAWVVGSHTTAQGVEYPVILRSTGGAWKAEHAPGKTVSLSEVSAASATRAYVVGLRYANGDIQKTFVEAFNGHTWKPVSSSF
jgi:hypothetical protein